VIKIAIAATGFLAY